MTAQAQQTGPWIVASVRADGTFGAAAGAKRYDRYADAAAVAADKCRDRRFMKFEPLRVSK